MKSKIYKYNIGFTLAEVLITLVIIGVIAAITVPSLMQTTHKQEYVVGLKKAHSVLSQSLYRMADNNGYPHGDYTFLSNENFLDEFEKIGNIIKKCSSPLDCFGSSLNANSTYKTLNGNISSGWRDGKSVITVDGQMYTFYKSSSITTYGISDEDKENLIGRIIVDLNGVKKPNRFGYDTFIFYIVDEKGIVPAGTSSTSDCTKSGRGAMCAGKVLKENKISY